MKIREAKRKLFIGFKFILYQITGILVNPIEAITWLLKVEGSAISEQLTAPYTRRQAATNFLLFWCIEIARSVCGY